VVVVGGERAGEGMGGTRDLTSGPRLPARERRERERGGATNRWGQAVRRGAGARSWAAWDVGGEGGGEAGATWARNGLAEGGERKCFSFFLFYFSFLFSISIFFLSPFSLTNN
jgi:hypothetical protein